MNSRGLREAWRKFVRAPLGMKIAAAAAVAAVAAGGWSIHRDNAERASLLAAILSCRQEAIGIQEEQEREAQYAKIVMDEYVLLKNAVAPLESLALQTYPGSTPSEALRRLTASLEPRGPRASVGDPDFHNLAPWLRRQIALELRQAGGRHPTVRPAFTVAVTGTGTPDRRRFAVASELISILREAGFSAEPGPTRSGGSKPKAAFSAAAAPDAAPLASEVLGALRRFIIVEGFVDRNAGLSSGAIEMLLDGAMKIQPDGTVMIESSP